MPNVENQAIPESIIRETKNRAIHKRRMFLLSVISVAVFLILWQSAVTFRWVNPKYVASPVQVVETFMQKLSDPKPDGATLGVHIYTSLYLVLVGYLAALVIGIPLGLVTGYYRVADKLISTIFEIVRPVPPIAWIPLSVVWLGIGTTAKAFIIFLAAFVPCVINSYTGIKLTNPVLINVAKTCGASNWKVFTTVCIPAAMPMVFTGIRVAIGNAWSTLVAAELLAATAGLGYMIQQGRSLIRSDIIIVGMLTIGVIGAILLWLLGILENNVIKWRAKK
jgi:taurine transport system permease protein